MKIVIVLLLLASAESAQSNCQSQSQSQVSASLPACGPCKTKFKVFSRGPALNEASGEEGKALLYVVEDQRERDPGEMFVTYITLTPSECEPEHVQILRNLTPGPSSNFSQSVLKR